MRHEIVVVLHFASLLHSYKVLGRVEVLAGTGGCQKLLDGHRITHVNCCCRRIGQWHLHRLFGLFTGVYLRQRGVHTVHKHGKFTLAIHRCALCVCLADKGRKFTNIFLSLSIRLLRICLRIAGQRTASEIIDQIKPGNGSCVNSKKRSVYWFVVVPYMIFPISHRVAWQFFFFAILCAVVILHRT